MNESEDPAGFGKDGSRKSLGRAGEAVARRYLESLGFHILEANYRIRSGEADIVAIQGKLLLFCEVKTRRKSGAAIEGYGRVQQQRLVKVSQDYIVKNGHMIPWEHETRYDVIIVGNGEGGALEVKEHIADAFRPQD